MKKIILLSILSLGFTSCSVLEGIGGTINIPLPDKFGGGILPITIVPEK